MKRDEARELLLAFIEGDLASEDSREMADLLARDPSLAREHEELKRLLADVGRGEHLVPPPGYHDHFYTRLRARMEEEGLAPDRPAPSRWAGIRELLRSRRGAWVPAAAAAVIVAIAALYLAVGRTLPAPNAVEPLLADAGDWFDAPDPEEALEFALDPLSPEQAEAVAEAISARIGADLAALDELELGAAAPFDDSWDIELAELAPEQAERLLEAIEGRMPGPRAPTSG